MFAPALGTEGRSEILECLSLLQCVSSRVLDCYCFWYFGAYHSFCLVDVYFNLCTPVSFASHQNGFASPSQFASPMPGHLHTACRMEPPCRYALIQICP